MARNYSDWLAAYVQYASHSEAPPHMHFWSGVSAIAGALRRRVWLDMAYFKWYPNMYILLVAPPGIVQKTTTAGIAMRLLRQVPGINFGPDIVTWPALVTAFAHASESFELNEEWHTMCAITLESGEFGNLLNPQDREMVDLLVTLWDGKQGGFNKVTKASGCDIVENPWINLIACTTPAWIAGNFPEYLIGGGFTSRCIFIFADTKAKLVAYPHLHVPADMSLVEMKLVQDLEHIATKLLGKYYLTPEAIAWGEAWYAHHYSHRPDHLDEDRFGGYIARKQTHIHKLAMILVAAQRDDLIILPEDLAIADKMVTDLEKDMSKVFSKIGRNDTSIQADRFISYVKRRGSVSYKEAYQFIHSYFPDLKDFEGIVAGAIRAGYMDLVQKGNEMFLEAKVDN